jgi:hypothetical protein
VSLAPAIDPLICGIHGKEPEGNDWCPVPECISRAQERHHLWSRSYLRGQPQNWVQLPSMSVCANVMRLCVRHHRDVTGQPGGHKGWIKLEHGDTFVYYEPNGNGWKPLGLLKPQPKILSTDHSLKRQKSEVEKAHHDLAPGETCDKCGYTRPRAREPLPRRKQATWTVNVPADAELGADVLDEWVEQFAAVLGFEEPKKGLARYHVISTIFAWAAVNKGTLIEDITEARMR